MKRFALLLVAVSILSFGCSKKAVQPDTQEPKAEVKKEAPKQEEVRKETPKAEPKAEPKVEAKAEPKAEPVKIVEVPSEFQNILFDFDKYDIKDAYKQTLKDISAYLLKNTDKKLMVEGNCDERGTNEYNLALGDRRAKAAKEFIVSQGVPSSRVDTISYGEEKPLCNEHNEDCWSKNRNDHFVILK